MDSYTVEQDLRAVYGAYEYLRAHDISDHSTTSRLLRAGDLAFLARRGADETDELRGVVMGTHAHSGGRDDVILEAYQCLYWLFALAVAAGDRYDDIRPGEALALASDNGAPLTTRAPLSPVSASTDFADTERRRRFVREGLAFIGEACRQAGVSVQEAVRRDLRELRAKEYLQPYWGAASSARGGPGRPRPDVAALSPYVPGRSAGEARRQYGLDHVVKLASNENPFGPSPRAVEAAMRVLAEGNRYPDGAAAALRERLAALYGLERRNVVVGNGSDEIILLLALAYLAPGDTAVMAAPPYAIHRSAVVTAGGAAIRVPLRDYVHDLDAMAAAVTERTRLVFVANPHNPTGTHIDRAALRSFAERLPLDVLLVVDEAYHDYVADDRRHTARDLLDTHPNVVTLRTFSKAHGLAGLRAGYALAHADVIAILDRIRPPFGLNIVAQAAALAALDDPEHIARVARENREGRARIQALAVRHGLETIPSETNFVLMRVGDSTALTESLLRRGVIVRPGENLGVPGWVRVSVGTQEDLDRFEEALGAALTM